MIIEQGKVLSAGSLREMSAKVEEKSAPAEEERTVAIILECAARCGELRLKLLENPAVAEVREDAGGRLHFALRDWENTLAPLMAGLFGAGFPITGFRKEEMGLEELFMRITTGKVQ